MTKEELLERYEAGGDETLFAEAVSLFERALEMSPSAREINDFGYLLACHGRRSLRQAVAHYERAAELDPDYDKPHLQLISALASLGESKQLLARYRERLAASPAGVREHRFLAQALVACREHVEAGDVIAAGLGLAPSDPRLIELRGDVRAASGDPVGALADWRRALELDPENLSAAYSTAFLFENEGRRALAAETWQFIIDWCDARGYALTAEWPRRELQRLRKELAELPG